MNRWNDEIVNRARAVLKEHGIECDLLDALVEARQDAEKWFQNAKSAQALPVRAYHTALVDIRELVLDEVDIDAEGGPNTAMRIASICDRVLGE
jgi:hypothetical protein